MCARLCGWVDAPTLPAPQNTDMFSTNADGAFWWGQRPRIVVLAFSVYIYIYMYLCGCVCLSGGVRVPMHSRSDAPRRVQNLGDNFDHHNWGHVLAIPQAARSGICFFIYIHIYIYKDR